MSTGLAGLPQCSCTDCFHDACTQSHLYSGTDRCLYTVTYMVLQCLVAACRPDICVYCVCLRPGHRIFQFVLHDSMLPLM